MTLTEEQRGTVGVDLEKARAALEEAIDRMSLAVRDEDGDVWEADPEQAEILQAILDRTEIAENHRCLELQYQLDSAESEIERLRPFEIAARDLDSDLGKIAGERDEQSARIKELEAERAVWIRHYNDTRKKHVALKKLGKMVRQRGKWLVEERANKMIQSDDCTQNEDAADFHHRCICEYNVKKCPIEQWWLDRARITLQAEGKIDNSNHIVGPDQMVPNGKVWQITEERKDALNVAVCEIENIRIDSDACPLEFQVFVDVLRAMLKEAEQCKWRRAHQ